MPVATPTGSVPSPSTVSGGNRRVGTAGQRQFRTPAHRSELSPVDLCVIGIVDEVVAGGKVVFHK